MNKKEILEIKKVFSPENCGITRMCGCYVDTEKNRSEIIEDTFLALPEEEMMKYFQIFKKSLSGSLGKNLFNMEFPLQEEMTGGKQETILQLRNSKLKQSDLIENFFNKIVSNFDTYNNYYIILLHGVYDIPCKTKDNRVLFDASEEVYEYIMCCICPVVYSKPGLSYHAEKGKIGERVRDQIVEMPTVSFLFPAFNDRTADIHQILYYSKNQDQLHENFINEVFGCRVPLPAAVQKECFRKLLEQTSACTYEYMIRIREKLEEIQEEQKDTAEPVRLTKDHLKKILEECGGDSLQLDMFTQIYKEIVGDDREILVENLLNSKRMEVESYEMMMRVKPEYAEIFEVQKVNGRPCLIVPIGDEIKVDGIKLS